MKPVRLSASATLALPRWGIFALCLLYILPGLIGRDPWKNDDAASFGVMWTLAHGPWSLWLAPGIVGWPIVEEGPLAFWLGALAIKCFGALLGDVMAARLITVAAFLLGATSIWYGTYLLGRRPEAQPLKLAFGGQPNARDYGRALADTALLIYLGCWGLLRNSHQTIAEALQIAFIAFCMYRMIRYFDAPSLISALWVGLALSALALTRGLAVPLVLWAVAGLCLSLPNMPHRKSWPDWAVALVTLLAVLALWRQFYHPPHWQGWLQWNRDQLAWPNLDAVRFFMRYGIWFFWPAWPFAAWAVYAWRRQRYALHMAFPAAVTAAFALLALLATNPAENQLLPLLPPLVMLAAFGLPTMKRGAINAVDWFAVLVASFSSALIWLAWIAHLIGWPAQLAKNVLKLVPGFTPELQLLPLLVALGASLGWVALIYWRISRKPSVLWRAVVLSSGGLILCWVQLMTLFLPWSNYRLSYEPVARQIVAHLPPDGGCIETNTTPAQRASFAYFGGLNFAPPQQRCDLLLLQSNLKRRDDGEMARQLRRGGWQLLWEGRRAADRDERFRLYRRQR